MAQVMQQLHIPEVLHIGPLNRQGALLQHSPGRSQRPTLQPPSAHRLAAVVSQGAWWLPLSAPLFWGSDLLAAASPRQHPASHAPAMSITLFAIPYRTILHPFSANQRA
jgi:hypothetical protein